MASADEASVQIIRSPRQDRMQALYHDLRAVGPAHRSPFGIVLVASYPLARTVLKHPSFGVTTATRLNRVWPGWGRHPLIQQLLDSMFGADPPEHAALRDPLHAYFTQAGVKSVRSAIARAVGDHELALRAPEPTEMISAFARPVATSVICDLLGFPSSDHHFLETHVAHWTAALELARGPGDILLADSAVTAINAYVADALSEARRSRADDFISELDRCGAFATDRALIANVSMLLAAGMETTSALLGNLLHSVATSQINPGTLADPAIAGQFIDECLRLTPPLQVASRVANADVHLDGFDFHEGDDVFVLIGACNRDPSVFSSPDTFEWKTARHKPISFGGGIHVCLGAALARSTALIALAALSQNPVRLRLAGPMTHNDRFVLSSLTDLTMQSGPDPQGRP